MKLVNEVRTLNRGCPGSTIAGRASTEGGSFFLKPLQLHFRRLISSYSFDFSAKSALWGRLRFPAKSSFDTF